MHIAASKPLAISIDKLDPELVEKEKQGDVYKKFKDVFSDGE